MFRFRKLMKILKITSLAFLNIVLLVSFGTVYAQSEILSFRRGKYRAYSEMEYQTQFSAQYSKFEEDDGTDQKFYVMEALIHFSPVNLEGHPFSLASFLERVGYLSLDIGLSEVKFNPSREADGTYYSLKTVYWRANSPFAIMVNFLKADF